MLQGTHGRTGAAQVRRAHRLGCGVPQPGLAGVVAPRHSTRPVVAASPLVLAGAHGRSLALTRRRFRSALTRARFRTTCRVRAGGHALGWACAGGWYPMVCAGGWYPMACAGGWYPMAGGIASDRPQRYGLLAPVSVGLCSFGASADLLAAQQSLAAWPSSDTRQIRSVRRGVDRAEIERR